MGPSTTLAMMALIRRAAGSGPPSVETSHTVGHRRAQKAEAVFAPRGHPTSSAALQVVLRTGPGVAEARRLWKMRREDHDLRRVGLWRLGCVVFGHGEG